VKNANLVSWRGALLMAAGLALTSCGKPLADQGPSIAPLPAAAAVAHYSYEVVAVWPHDREAFTQGLVFRHGSLIESTGLNGQSSLREVDVKTGRILKQVAVPAQFFAEGLAVLGDRAYQLTWRMPLSSGTCPRRTQTPDRSGGKGHSPTPVKAGA
jgi:glutamine cyclotransferase